MAKDKDVTDEIGPIDPLDIDTGGLHIFILAKGQERKRLLSENEGIPSHSHLEFFTTEELKNLQNIAEN